MDLVSRLDWWLEREGPYGVPHIEIGVSAEVRCLREDIAEAADEIERLRALLLRAGICRHGKVNTALCSTCKDEQGAHDPRDDFSPENDPFHDEQKEDGK